MKAAILTRYDKNATDLEVREIPTPAPASGEVLVKIHTAAVNPLDNMMMRGEVKLITPYTLPLVMGNEFSGVVEKVGAMAIPLAKSLGLTVATNGNGENEERVRALGADIFIDYKKQSYADVLSEVDLVLDTLGDRELPTEFKILKEGGRLVSLRGMPNGRFARRMGLPWYKRFLLSLAGRKYDAMAARKKQTYDFIFVHEDGAQLESIASLFPAERPLTASIDATFTLDQINKALAKVRAGGSQGKTIVRIGDFQ